MFKCNFKTPLKRKGVSKWNKIIIITNVMR